MRIFRFIFTVLSLVCFVCAGSAVAATGVVVSPTGLDFGSQVLFTTSGSQTVTITNNLLTSISLTGLTVSGDFRKTTASTCGTSLSANRSCTLDMVFYPTATGTRTGSISMSGVSGVSLAGVGIADTTAPTAILSAPATLAYGQGFTLDGSRSFDSGGGAIAQYRWTSLDASTANMTANTPVVTTTPTFAVSVSAATPLPLGVNRFQLQVVDTSGNVSTAASVSVVVVDNVAPTAVLTAPSTASYGQGFTLNGSKSFDSGGGTISQYKWTSLDASTGNMTVNTPVSTTTPTFAVSVSPANPLPPGVYHFQLQVVDTSGNVSTAASVSVIVVDNVAPTAVLTAPTNVAYGQGFTLDGSTSFDSGGGSISQYKWTSLDASTANMTVNTPVSTVTPTFAVSVSPANPLPPGVNHFQLQVVDSSGNVSTAASVSVVVVDSVAPTAVLTAPASVAYGQGFTLNGSKSFDSGGGTIAQYRWTSLDASTANMTANTPVVTTTPTFAVTVSAATLLPLGVNRFQLQVVDTSGNVSTTAIVNVVVVDNVAPTAVLTAPTNVAYGQGFTLNGSKSFDSGGGTISQYKWTSLDASTGNMTVNTPVSTTTPTFAVTVSAANPLPPGVYHFQLVAVDSSGNVSTAASVSVTVVPNCTLSVAFSGAGGTSIVSTPAGIVCQAGLPTANCSYDFSCGSTVTLTAAADGISELAGWTNADTPTGNPVSVTMDVGKTVTAAFATIQTPVLIYGGQGYTSLQQAIAGVTGSCTIMLQASYADSTPQTLLFNNGYTVYLTGGFDAGWHAVAGATSRIRGNLTVGDGTVVIDGLELDP